jgi:hypothetical protein
MPRKKVKKRPANANGGPGLPGIARPDWAWFTVNKGTSHAHRTKKGKGSYSRRKKHPGEDGA